MLSRNSAREDPDFLSPTHTRDPGSSSSKDCQEPETQFHSTALRFAPGCGLLGPPRWDELPFTGTLRHTHHRESKHLGKALLSLSPKEKKEQVTLEREGQY